MALKTAFFILLLLCIVAVSVQAQLVARRITLHNGYEDDKLVRNHTVAHYYHSGKKLVAGFITINQIIEYAHSSRFEVFNTITQTDTLLHFHGIVDKGRKNGTFLNFSNENIFYLYSFENDKENGVYVGYYSSGQIYCKGVYKNGKQIGEYRQYYASGKPSLYKVFSEGIVNLLYEEYYYQNGQVESKGTLYNGKKVNEWYYYSYQGSLIRTEYYNSKGRLVTTRQGF